jgi:hypothetical protein
MGLMTRYLLLFDSYSLAIVESDLQKTHPLLKDGRLLFSRIVVGIT